MECEILLFKIKKTRKERGMRIFVKRYSSKKRGIIMPCV